MKAIFKKEFRSVALSNLGIAFIGLFLCIAGGITAYWNLTQLTPSFEVVFSSLPLAMVVLLPMITIGTFSKERREGTDRFLAMLPLSTKDIVLGKYFARLAFAMIPNALLLLVPVILDLWGDVNYTTAYVALVAFSLLEALLISICLYVDTLCKRRNISIAIPYCALIVLFALRVVGKMIPTSNFLLNALSTFLLRVSPFALFEDFLYGIVDFRVIFVYLSLTVLFVALSVLAFGKNNGSYKCEEYKNTADAKNGRVISLVVAAAILVANVGVLITSDRLSKIDITAERTYTLSAETKDFLDSLDKEVTLYIIDPDSSEYREKLFLDRMADYSKKLTVKEINTQKDIEFCIKYGIDSYDTGALANSIIIESDARYRMIYASSLFTYTNKNEAFGFERISASEFQQYYSMFASNTQYAEYLDILMTETDIYFEGQTIIPQYIEYVAADYIPTIHVLGGHGAGVSGSLFAEISAYSGINYKTLDLSNGAEITKEVAAIIIARPETDLSDSETAAIKKYLSEGGQITVLTNESNLSMNNLMSILASYGMTASDGTLAQITTTQGEEEGAVAVETETTDITVDPNNDHDIMAAISSQLRSFVVTVDKANAIAFDTNNSPDLILTPLLKTSENAYFAGNADSKGIYTVAATAEKARGDRVVWFTGAESILGIGDISLMDDQQVTDTMTAVLAASWTNNVYTSELTVAPATLYTSRPVQMSETTATVLGMVFVAIVPAAVVGICVMIRYKRERA